MFNALVELSRGKAFEIRALPPIDINDLDVVTCLHEIGLCRLAVDTHVTQRIRERVWQSEPRLRFESCPFDHDGQ